MPKALFQTESASGQVVTYTVSGTIINADSKAVIETVTQTVISSNSATLTFAPIAVQTPIILSIEVYAGNELYMSGTSARHIVVEGAQSLDITLIKANGEKTTGTGTITGTAKYKNSSDHSNIVIFIQKEESVSSTDEIISTNKTSLNFVSSRSASRLASTSASNITLVSALACVKADSDGNYSFKNLSAGSYSVYATSLNSTKAAYNTVTVSDDTATAVNLDLTATGSISGTVQLDSNTTGNGGISVYIGGTSYIAITDDTGAFTISNVPASSEAYTLCALYGTTVRTLTTTGSIIVTEGDTAAAGTMTFATVEAKHYLYVFGKDSDGNTTKKVTTSYVQATKNGLKFVLSDSDLPAKTAIVELFVTNLNTKVRVCYTINHVSEITGDAVFTFRLTNKNIQYTNVFVGFCESTWANYTTIGLNENITSIGGDGEITATAADMKYDKTSNTITLSSPVFDYSNFDGQISSYPTKIAKFQVVANNTYNEISIPSSNSINLFTDFSPYCIGNFSGQTAVTFNAFYNVILAEDLLYTASVNSNSDGESYNAEPSCSYNIFTQTLTGQTINTYTPTLTAWANGGIVTKLTTTTTEEIGEAYTTSTTEVPLNTSTSTLGDLFTAISTLHETYTFIYKSNGTTDINISDKPYVKDTNNNYWPLSGLEKSTDLIGYRSFTVYPVWTLTASANWTGLFILNPKANGGNKALISSSFVTSTTASAQATLTIIASSATAPIVATKDENTTYSTSAGPKATEDSTGYITTYTIPSSTTEDLYIYNNDSSDITITSISLAAN